MKVLLVNIDSKKVPNIALKKIEKYHRDRGDEVIWDYPLLAHTVDKIYVSCVFKENRHKCDEWEGRADIGGSGYDLKKTLPPEIDNIKLHINYGFTSRGCSRQCGFCIVPEKEGQIHPTGDLYDVWDGKSKEVILMDNNILALPKHFKLVSEQITREGVRVDFNQGLDHRLLNDENCRLLSRMKRKYYRFSFDNVKQFKTVRRALKLLGKYNIKWSTWYILVGHDSTIEQDLKRLNYLKDNNQRVYVQRFKKKPELTNLARWANQPAQFIGKTYEQFLTS